MTVKRMDNVGIFTELGLELEGRATIEGTGARFRCYIRGPEGLLIGLAQELG